jgi:hypothetical protein
VKADDRLLEDRCTGFTTDARSPDYELEILLSPPPDISPDADVRV